MNLLVSTEEARRAVGLGRSKFYELMASGEVEWVKVGTRRLVVADSLVAFVDRLRGCQRESAPGHHAGADLITTTTADPTCWKGGARGPR